MFTTWMVLLPGFQGSCNLEEGSLPGGVPVSNSPCNTASKRWLRTVATPVESNWLKVVYPLSDNWVTWVEMSGCFTMGCFQLIWGVGEGGGGGWGDDEHRVNRVKRSECTPNI